MMFLIIQTEPLSLLRAVNESMWILPSKTKGGVEDTALSSNNQKIRSRASLLEAVITIGHSPTVALGVIVAIIVVDLRDNISSI
jgi:hypothetical protein